MGDIVSAGGVPLIAREGADGFEWFEPACAPPPTHIAYDVAHDKLRNDVIEAARYSIREVAECSELHDALDRLDALADATRKADQTRPNPDPLLHTSRTTPREGDPA